MHDCGTTPRSRFNPLRLIQAFGIGGIDNGRISPVAGGFDFDTIAAESDLFMRPTQSERNSRVENDDISAPVQPYQRVTSPQPTYIHPVHWNRLPSGFHADHGPLGFAPGPIATATVTSVCRPSAAWDSESMLTSRGRYAFNLSSRLAEVWPREESQDGARTLLQSCAAACRFGESKPSLSGSRVSTQNNTYSICNLR